MKRLIMVVPMLVALGMLWQACGETEELLECTQICEDYNDCLIDDVDTSQCIDICEDRVDRDPVAAANLERCEDCLEANEDVCRDTGENPCAAECAGILPQ